MTVSNFGLNLLLRIPGVAPLIARLPDETVVIDTSNYYPLRDDKIEAIEAGQVESLWVVEQLGRPIAKAWNAIGSGSLAHKATPAGTAGRIAIPVAADRPKDREVALALVNDSGFDGFDAGSLATRGINSQVLQFTAPISRERKWDRHSALPRGHVCRSAVISVLQ